MRGLSPHVTTRARLGNTGVVFPLKKRYAESNITLDGVEAEWEHHNPHAPPTEASLATQTGPTFGASDDWLQPFDPSDDTSESIKPDETEQLKTKADPPPSPYMDKLGRVYPVDTYGTINRKAGRPFGVTTEQWTNASRKQQKE